MSTLSSNQICSRIAHSGTPDQLIGQVKAAESLFLTLELKDRDVFIAALTKEVLDIKNYRESIWTTELEKVLEGTTITALSTAIRESSASAKSDEDEEGCGDAPPSLPAEVTALLSKCFDLASVLFDAYGKDTDKSCQVSYNTATDKYSIRQRGKSLDMSASVWRSLTLPPEFCREQEKDAYGNIFRVEEVDWNMVYLSRGTSSPGKIAWGFNLKDTNLDSLTVTTKNSLWRDGKVEWFVVLGFLATDKAGDKPSKGEAEAEGEEKVANSRAAYVGSNFTGPLNHVFEATDRLFSGRTVYSSPLGFLYYTNAYSANDASIADRWHLESRKEDVALSPGAVIGGMAGSILAYVITDELGGDKVWTEFRDGVWCASNGRTAYRSPTAPCDEPGIETVKGIRYESKLLSFDEANSAELNNLSSSSPLLLILEAVLTGVEDGPAHQNAQIFRQSTSEESENAIMIDLRFTPPATPVRMAKRIRPTKKGKTSKGHTPPRRGIMMDGGAAPPRSTAPLTPMPDIPSGDADCAPTSLSETTSGMVNRAGVPVTLGTHFGCTDRYYCGRRLGRSAIPGSDGQCGPNNGPQCADCAAEISHRGNISSSSSTPAATSTPSVTAALPPVRATGFGTSSFFGAPSTSSASSGAPPSFTPTSTTLFSPAPSFSPAPAPFGSSSPFTGFGSRPSGNNGASPPPPAFGSSTPARFGGPPAGAFPGSPSPFGSSSTPPPPAFGSAATTSGFGAPSFTSFFGASAPSPAPAFGAGSSSSSFGTGPAPSFGAGSSSSSFGTGPAPSFGGFGSSTAPAPSFGGFGSTINPPRPATGVFGPASSFAFPLVSTVSTAPLRGTVSPTSPSSSGSSAAPSSSPSS